MPQPPSLLCGLLARFVGARFVAASRSTFVCQIGAHSMASAVTIHFVMTSSTVRMTVYIKNNAGKVYSKTNSIINDSSVAFGPSFDADVVHTALVASWAAAILVRTTFMQIPYSGTPGKKSVTSVTIAVACFRFCGNTIRDYSALGHIATGGRATVTFWPRHVSFKVGDFSDVVHIPHEIGAHDSGDYMRYTYNETVVRNVVDELIVQSCQTLCILKSKHRSATKNGMVL